MTQLLKTGQVVRCQTWGKPCQVQDFLGGGGQGEVYLCQVDGQPFALKWYFTDYRAKAPRLRQRLEWAAREGPPSDRFLWPLDLAAADDGPGFGYLMKLREPRFRGMVDWLKRRVNPSFAALATAGFELADGYLLLHARKGLCYRDINYNNVFFDPDTGEVRVCDNDNVDVNGQPGEIGGTPSFMAPEIVRGEALPSIETDRHSLAVLLFLMFLLHHPLEGQREAAIHCLDNPARRKLYGDAPLFIFDPHDPSNRPVPEVHANALAYWPVYPHFLRELFTRAFTDGLRDPKNGRVVESEWRAAMIRLRDAVMDCPACRAENFYDPEALGPSGTEPARCWHCDARIPPPLRVRLGKAVVVLRPGKQLFPHHLDPRRFYDFSAPLAEVTRHPANPAVLGLQNLSAASWTYQAPGQEPRAVERGKNCRLADEATINFGAVAGEVRG
jgi:DNA-binding helix-hairpin-helix protein with protein kinase domain